MSTIFEQYKVTPEQKAFIEKRMEETGMKTRKQNFMRMLIADGYEPDPTTCK